MKIEEQKRTGGGGESTAGKRVIPAQIPEIGPIELFGEFRSRPQVCEYIQERLLVGCE